MRLPAVFLAGAEGSRRQWPNQPVTQSSSLPLNRQTLSKGLRERAPALDLSPHAIVVVHFHRGDLARQDNERSVLALRPYGIAHEEKIRACR